MPYDSDAGLAVLFSTNHCISREGFILRNSDLVDIESTKGGLGSGKKSVRALSIGPWPPVSL